MTNTSFTPWPSFSEEEARVIYDILLSNKVNYWTGSEGRNFENEFANNSRNIANLLNDAPLKTPHSIISPGKLFANLNNS